VKLPPTLEQFIAAQVEQGVYRSREAAIVAAVTSEMRRVEQRIRLERALQNGLDSKSAGALDINDVIRRGRVRQAARKRHRTV
jgi:putative addiction module CopG family antidote